MSIVKSHLAVSLDGYAAGPDQSPEHPLGRGGERLHEWMDGRDEPDRAVLADVVDGVAAYVMGRNMFGGEPGDTAWRGWWGEDPPFHVPVFVLTHHEREPLEMRGGTTFTFVTGGIHEALDRARAAAGGGTVDIAGGASTVRQYLVAGLLDELLLHVVPVVLGAGERLLDGVGDVRLEQVGAIPSRTVTHLRYRVRR
jgi:dihydrofolate reductase